MRKFLELSKLIKYKQNLFNNLSQQLQDVLHTNKNTIA